MTHLSLRKKANFEPLPGKELLYAEKNGIRGRECDVRQEQDVVRAAAKLAVLHKDMEKLAVKSGPERMHREKSGGRGAKI